jgi:hypothetical protein
MGSKKSKVNAPKPAYKLGRNGNWARYAALYEGGMAQSDIARECGVSRQAVFIGLSAMGFETAPKAKKKSNKKKSKK